MFFSNTQRIFDRALSSAKSTVFELKKVVSLNTKQINKNDKRINDLSKENIDLVHMSKKAESISNKLSELFELE